MCPHIEVKPFAINSINNDVDDNDSALYHVFLSQGKLKLRFLVCQRPASHNPNREYETIRCEDISLHGIEERDKYLEVVDNIGISADETIVNEIFISTLEPYGIRLIKVTFHNFEFFESAIEGQGFLFENQELYEKLKDLINKTCLKMLKNPHILEY